jgi:lysophospholipase L1-like esterase
MKTEELKERVEPLVRTLRRAHPQTPILLVDTPIPSSTWGIPSNRKTADERNAAQRAAFDRLVAEGAPHLHYLSSETFRGPDGEGTVDGGHPTDLGFLRMADAFAPVLIRLLLERGATE